MCVTDKSSRIEHERHVGMMRSMDVPEGKRCVKGLDINQVLRCSWMLWLRVRLMNRSIVVFCCVSRMLVFRFCECG